MSTERLRKAADAEYVDVGILQVSNHWMTQKKNSEQFRSVKAYPCFF